MRKKLSEILNDATAGEMESAAICFAETPMTKEMLASVKNRAYKKTGLKNEKGEKRSFRRLRYFVAAAACIILIIAATVAISIFRRNSGGNNNNSYVPIVNIQIPSSAPHYYESMDSIDSPPMGSMMDHPLGLSVTARLIEALPDTYTFYDDWQQEEFRLLRMETVKLLGGIEMTQEFYYLIPVDFMTDFSVFDKFVIMDMAQFFYEYSVMYNKSRGTAEQLTLVVFGYRPHNYTKLGSRFIAYDSDGDFDSRLWESNDAWTAATKNASAPKRLEEAEAEAEKKASDWFSGEYYGVLLLSDISNDAENILSQLKSFDNSIFVITCHRYEYGIYQLGSHINVTKYINGFATNESITIKSKLVTGTDQNKNEVSKAQFSDDDMSVLPDLTSAIYSVADAFSNGGITPPHIVGHGDLQLKKHGIFGWYAKTTDGIIGVVRVSWKYSDGKRDDAYYIVEYGSDKCVSIDRDSLLDRLGEYEKTYIYTGGYNENGKDDVPPYF